MIDDNYKKSQELKAYDNILMQSLRSKHFRIVMGMVRLNIEYDLLQTTKLSSNTINLETQYLMIIRMIRFFSVSAVKSIL
jgi:hypothetical protein